MWLWLGRLMVFIVDGRALIGGRFYHVLSALLKRHINNHLFHDKARFASGFLQDVLMLYLKVTAYLYCSYNAEGALFFYGQSRHPSLSCILCILL